MTTHTPYAHIAGWGMAVPPQVLTNAELAGRVDTTDEWIVARTGIRERRIAAPRETTFTLALRAAEEALDVAGLPADELDLVIVATSTPDYVLPATACLVQDALGAHHAAAFDLAAACTGFLYALSLATQSIRAGAARTALIIGAETLSRIVNWQDRGTCILFGDGAGAVVLRAGEARGGVLATTLRADGSGAELLIVPAGGSRLPASTETVAGNQHTITMDGREVFRFATRAMTGATRQVLADAGLKTEELALVIPHQANARIIESAARALGMPVERFFMNLERYGNTSAASIPIALCEAAAQGRLKPNDHVVLVAFGAGLTWGATLVHWGVTPPPPSRTRRFLVRLRRLLGRLRSLFSRQSRHIESLLEPEENGGAPKARARKGRAQARAQDAPEQEPDSRKAP